MALSVRSMLTALIVVVVGLAIAKSVTTFSGYFIIVGAGAFLLGLMLTRNLQLGLFLYICTAALQFGESPGVQSPNSGYKAGLMPSQVFLAFLVALWFGRGLFGEGLRLVKSKLNIPLMVFSGVALLSMAVCNILRGTREMLFHQLIITQVAEVGLLFCSVFAFFLAANALRDERWIRRISVPVILLGLNYVASEVFGLELPVPINWGYLLLAMALAFVYSRLLFDKLSRGKAIGFALLLLVLLYTAFHNLAWLSGVVMSIGTVLTITWLRSKWLAVGLLAVLLLVVFVYPGYYHDIYGESESGGDFDRFTIWRDAFVMMVSVNPILGVGPGNYHSYVYYHNRIWFGSHTYTTAHSNYAQITAELGLLGLAVFLWVIVAGIRAGFRAVRESGPEFKWLTAAAVSIFAGMVVASIFGDYLFPSRGNNGIENFGTTVYAWLIMGAAVAATNLSKGASASDR